MESYIVCFVNLWTSLVLGIGIADKLDQRLHEYLQNGGGLLFDYAMLLFKDFGKYFAENHFTKSCYILTQPAITCSKFKIETLEEGVKYVPK